MHPILFRIGGHTIPSYGAMFLTGIVLALLVGRAVARRQGLSPERAVDLVFWGGIGGVVGARALWLVILIAQRGYSALSWSEILFGAGVYYGGLAGMLAGVFLCIRTYHLPAWEYIDAILPGMVYGHAVGRVGCFLAGCCYGAPTSSFLSVTFTDPVCQATFGTPLGVPLHPVQLYECVGEIAIASALLFVLSRRAFAGQVLPAYLLMYGPLRFGLEMLRADFRGEWLGGTLSTSQLLSLLAIPIALALWALLRRRQQAAAAVPARRRPAASARPARAAKR